MVVLSAGLLFIYQAWPWPEWRFASGVWRLFPWLNALESLVIDVEVKYHVFGVLFLIPIVYGSLTLSWPGGIFAWCLALIWVLPTVLSWWNAPVLINLALLLLPVLLVAIVTGERRWRESEKKHFVEREQARQAYIAKLVETQEAERRRIAQELHDETLQTLMVIANKSESLALSGTDESQVKGNLWIKQEVLQTMDDLQTAEHEPAAEHIGQLRTRVGSQVAGQQQQQPERLPSGRQRHGDERKSRAFPKSPCSVSSRKPSTTSSATLTRRAAP